MQGNISICFVSFFPVMEIMILYFDKFMKIGTCQENTRINFSKTLIAYVYNKLELTFHAKLTLNNPYLFVMISFVCNQMIL